MKDELSGNSWITLNATYFISPLTGPLELLDDASLLLDGARGITQCLSDLLGQAGDVNHGDLAQALWGASALIELGQRNAQVAHARLCAMRREIWNAPESSEDAETCS
ncbi:hypothetical protein ISP15_17065 [Dyella jejuensis]|uniref:Uncharacterized protein n=1 Tax=Dyella jejuensis TaxID=1432009 RepID=A0ABW8JP54_9GAMM